jgi:hypothetical protein
VTTKTVVPATKKGRSKAATIQTKIRELETKLCGTIKWLFLTKEKSGKIQQSSELAAKGPFCVSYSNFIT